MRRWLSEEHKSKKGGKEIDLSEWENFWMEVSPISALLNRFAAELTACIASRMSRSKATLMTAASSPFVEVFAL